MQRIGVQQRGIQPSARLKSAVTLQRRSTQGNGFFSIFYRFTIVYTVYIPTLKLRRGRLQKPL